MNKVNKINEKLINLSKIKYIILAAIISYVISSVMIALYLLFDFNMGRSMINELNISVIETILWSVILSPIIETLLFQTLIFKLTEGYNIKEGWTIIISAFCFSAGHLIYSVFYSFNAFVIGVILAYSFALYKDKKDKPTQTVIIIHSLINCITITLQLIVIQL